MNRSQIENLTPEELRVEVAKAKGWTKISLSTHNNSTWGLPPGKSSPWQGNIIPGWPTDIFTAWQLVEEMRIADWNPSIYWDDVDDKGPGNWACCIEHFGKTEEEYICFVSIGKTAPIAICKCYLLWKSEDK